MTSSGTPGEIRLEGVTKQFDVRRGEVLTAVGPIDLVMQPGEFVAVIGPSGCGKSTVLRMMAGLEEPTTGTVLIDGQPPSASTMDRQVGIAFQDHALLPWLSVWDNVALPFKLAGERVDHDRVAGLLELVGLDEFHKARPKQLSGGMRQRASIARALSLQPSVLLLDEPFGALDAVTRRRLNIELQRIWTELAATTLLVTHSVDEAAFLADRVVVLSERPGCITIDQQIDFPRPRPRDLMTDPAFQRIESELLLALDGAEAA
jgi:NitT/TauT family transport system ATP-binding protein